MSRLVTQSIIVPKDKYTIEKAREWVVKHGYKEKFGNKKGVDESD